MTANHVFDKDKPDNQSHGRDGSEIGFVSEEID